MKNIYKRSPSIQKYSYQKLIKCFSNCIPINIIPIIINEENLDPINGELVNDKDHGISGKKIETQGSVNESKKLSRIWCTQSKC